jgi:hypothetical protein
MKKYYLLTLISALFIFSGCILPIPGSGEIILVPEFDGKVLDSLSNEPVEGALIIVDDRKDSLVKTQPDGSFHMKEIRHAYNVTFMSPGGAEGYLPPAGDIRWLLKATHPRYKVNLIYLSQYIYKEDNTNKPKSPLIIRLEPK